MRSHKLILEELMLSRKLIIEDALVRPYIYARSLEALHHILRGHIWEWSFARLGYQVDIEQLQKQIETKESIKQGAEWLPFRIEKQFPEDQRVYKLLLVMSQLWEEVKKKAESEEETN